MDPTDTLTYDVCIVGAGPAGLATLSALRSPYTLDSFSMSASQVHRANKTMNQTKKCLQQRIVVVDTNSHWMQTWQDQFEFLGIDYLRSPVLAHPDLFDPNALLSFAVQRDRTDELLESGCFAMKHLLALGESQIGLWKLPSTKLFVDFCLDLADQLPHTFVGKTRVVDIVDASPGGKLRGTKPTLFGLELQSDDGSITTIQAKSVVLALGPVGHPVVPETIQETPNWRFWNQKEWAKHNEKEEDKVTVKKASAEKDTTEEEDPIMVLGGGLTAVQVALKIVEEQKQLCILCSRRPLVEQHFDIPVEWFDRRTTNRCMSEFFDHPIEQRTQCLRDARMGGSVPPMYMRRLEAAQQCGCLQCRVGRVEYHPPQPLLGECAEHNSSSGTNGESVEVKIHSPEVNSSGSRCANGSAGEVTSTSTIASGEPASFWVREIVVACGSKPDYEASPLLKLIQSQWPAPICGGLPCLTDDLRWNENVNIFCVGSLGALSIGPDAGNLMGSRKAAQLVANALESRSWLRNSVLKNPFDLLEDDDTTDGEESECSTCCGCDDENNAGLFIFGEPDP